MAGRPGMSDPIARALADCAEAVAELDRRCCDPGRSPRMAELAAGFEALRDRLPDLAEDAAQARFVADLEALGARVGALQVGCCAPDRLPLYARILERLTSMQRLASSARDAGSS